jgi:hypothetical protein
LLRTIDKSQLKALSGIAHNVIKGSVILSPSDKNRLKKYKKVLSVLVSSESGDMSTTRYPNGSEVASANADVNILERPGKSCLPGVFNAMVLDFVPLGKMFCVMNTTLSLRW